MKPITLTILYILVSSYLLLLIPNNSFVFFAYIVNLVFIAPAIYENLKQADYFHNKR